MRLSAGTSWQVMGKHLVENLYFELLIQIPS